jgi:hypothetical protein
MSAIVVSAAVPVLGSNVSTPCGQYLLRLVIDWDTNVSPEVQFFTASVYDGYGSQQDFLVSFQDIFETNNGVITYVKDVEVNRWSSQALTQVRAYNSSETESDFLFFTPLGQWEISNVLATTDINGQGTVTVTTQTNNNTVPLQLELSVNDVDYFGTNTLTGLTAGDYTLYVRDAYGCKQTATFTINETPNFQVYNNFKFVSPLNPIVFAEVNDNLPSYLNTLSYSQNTPVNYRKNYYRFTDTETGRYQFRSNFDVNKVFLLNCGEVVNEIAVDQISDNLNQQDIRDAQLFFDNGFLYAYFNGTGNIYDTDGNVIGQNTLNGDLLLDQVQGELLVLETYGVVEILDLVDFDGIGTAMKLNYTTPIVESTLKLTTYYDLDNFEVYEFSVNYDLTESEYQLAIVNTTTADYDANNPLSSATFISEIFEISQEISDFHKIEWKNSENNQISWDTGIQCFNRLPYRFEPTFEPIDENEIYTTDTTKFMLESEVYESYVFNFEPLPLNMARQILYISSSDYLKIDDVFYVKEETPEMEAAIGSNLYIVKLKLTVASNYNSNEREGMTTSRGTVDTEGFLKLN